jgi:hypothetical protein
MMDFPQLLIRASIAMGTPLRVAMHLRVDPADVYWWIAGVARPDRDRLAEFAERLQTAGRSTSLNRVPPGYGRRRTDSPQPVVSYG